MPRIVLATTTFYKDVNNVRFQCALKTVQEAKKCGYNIAIVDDSPSLEITKALSGAGAVVFSGIVPGMGLSRRKTIQNALDAGAEIVVWIEPEKYPLVPLLEPCIKMVDSGEYDMVIPRRRTLTGYPFYQHWSELEANWRIGEITNRPDLDLMIGPRVMNRQSAELFLEYKGEPYGDFWQGVFIVVLRAIAKGMNVGSCTVNYVHPPEQTEEEQGSEIMNKKRDRQRIVLVETLAKEAALLGIKSL